MSKHCILPALCRDWAITLPGERQTLDLPWLVKALGLFAPWANCVYYHTFLVSVRSTAVKQAGRLSKPLFPGVKSCHLRMCHFCFSALSHLLAHFAWAGEICATCHCLPVWPWDWWNTFSEKVMVTDRVFTSFCVEKRAMTINQYYFHALSRKRQGWFYFRKFALYLSHATVNKQRKIYSIFIQFHATQLMWIVSATLWLNTTMTVVITKLVIPCLMTANACFVVPSCHNSY